MTTADGLPAEAALGGLREAGVIAVLRAPSAGAALDTAAALIRGGVHALEITYTTPDVPGVLHELARRYGDDVLLGAGTLTHPDQAAIAWEAGARFLVTPGFDDAVVTAMIGTGATTLAGAFTPTEILRARSSGVDAIKLFPAGVGGVGLLRAVREPFPDLLFVPTGGVRVDNVADWVGAGAAAIGVGGALCPASAIAAGHFEDITERAAAFVRSLERARGSA
ncbi:MAG: 2-dehydro-3-deoxyphosphogluconate aldolase / (4S)-4-hydroxy-2-oxoglutarate aldolase [Baekduia sp.]|nr:2-dehydro-3-deoxyphosphogluconate aldolase / (4S)-4-hydroxy-2-oxoglutarate aldolase [Baekduia sp.]